MSSVLSPVGPQPARVYWVRRLIVLGAPLILIIVIAVSCGGGGGKPSASSSGPGETPTTTPGTTAPTDCAAGDLKAAISTSEPVYAPGDAPVFTGILTNVSTVACRLTTSPANETWTVESGADHYWSTSQSEGCPSTGEPTTKLLQPNASQTVTITWNGKRLIPGCTSGDEASHGTYVLHAKLDGVTAPPVSFAIHDDA